MSKKETNKNTEEVLSKLGDIKALSVKENADGSVDVEVEVDDQFIELYKAKTGKKKVTEKGVSKFISDLLQESVNEVCKNAKGK